MLKCFDLYKELTLLLYKVDCWISHDARGWEWLTFVHSRSRIRATYCPTTVDRSRPHWAAKSGDSRSPGDNCLHSGYLPANCLSLLVKMHCKTLKIIPRNEYEVDKHLLNIQLGLNICWPIFVCWQEYIAVSNQPKQYPFTQTCLDTRYIATVTCYQKILYITH